ncbi:MAG: hypothetical protein R3D52_09530 [Xanthobacteraceae bacterium]
MGINAIAVTVLKRPSLVSTRFRSAGFSLLGDGGWGHASSKKYQVEAGRPFAVGSAALRIIEGTDLVD